jgi:hypothetical protein
MQNTFMLTQTSLEKLQIYNIYYQQQQTTELPELKNNKSFDINFKFSLKPQVQSVVHSSSQ